MTSRTACELCKASKSVKSFEDGTYCFACQEMSTEKKIKTIHRDVKSLSIPNMAMEHRSLLWEQHALGYMSRYNISSEDVNKHDLYYSEEYGRIVFPMKYTVSRIPPEKEVLFVWMRSTTQQPKWLLAGKYLTLYKCSKNKEKQTKGLCIVEDPISCVRVSNFVDCIALGSTSCSKEHLYMAIKDYDEISIWLDGDRAGIEGAVKLRDRLKLLKKVRIIYTKQDPKDYNNQEIKNFY